MQNYQNHRKFVPAFHFVALPIFLTNFFWRSYQAVVAFSWETVLSVAVAIALVITAFLARVFALRVQDRVIRLEMRLKMRGLLPPDMQSRIHEFTAGQMVALRFAGDAELPALAASVLRDNIRDKDTIKKMITAWQADDLRA